MANSLDLDGRGPTDRQLLGYGIVVLLVIALTTATLMAKSTGRLNAYVRIVADLVNVGDGLPSKSDVKYHGLLVGAVTDVVPAAFGRPNYVHIDLKPEYAKDIPNTVTARVVPSNVFAVSSVQLVDRGDGPVIADGAHIVEDDELSTVIFQTTISKLRDILAATGRGREDHSVGILAAVGAATENRRAKLLNAGAHMTRLLDQLNGIIATEPGPSTVTALVDAARGLQVTAPDLVDALHQAVTPMQTFVEEREQLKALIGGAANTLGTTREAFDNQTDRLIQITHDFTPVIGVFANAADKFVPMFTRLNGLSKKFFSELYRNDLITRNMRVNVSVTPLHTYTRADCPRYGEVKGPSCFTAPEVAVRAELPEIMLPQSYKPPAGLEPPAGTKVGPDGNLIAIGPPLINPPVDVNDPKWNPPLPWWTGPDPRIPTTADPDGEPPPPPPPPIPAFPSAPEWQPAAPVAPGPSAAPAAYGGNVGSVGSQSERNQLGVITGRRGPATVATQLLLGPVARGTAVSLAEKSSPAAGSVGAR